MTATSDIGISWWDGAPDHQEPCPCCGARVAMIRRDLEFKASKIELRCRRCRNTRHIPDPDIAP